MIATGCHNLFSSIDDQLKRPAYFMRLFLLLSLSFKKDLQMGDLAARVSYL